MDAHRLFTTSLVLSLALSVGAPFIQAQDQVPHRGRKYKAPPETSHIEVLVLRGYNGKPIENAAVIFHSLMEGKEEGNLEVKTNGEGKAVIDVIPTGSQVDVQIIADGFATYAGAYVVKEADRAIEIRMERPRAQVSTYVDNGGKPSDRSAGVQEPKHLSSPPIVQTPKPAKNNAEPNHIEPNHIEANPSAPNASPGNSQNSASQPH